MDIFRQKLEKFGFGESAIFFKNFVLSNSKKRVNKGLFESY